MQTLYMTAISVVATFILGILLGLLLFLTGQRKYVARIKPVNTVISAIVNIFRSIPFIILIVLLIPFTNFIFKTMIGENAALPALIIGAAPFYARMVEIGLREIDKGVIEACKIDGSNNMAQLFGRY